jgi:hypothetical protein
VCQRVGDAGSEVETARCEVHILPQTQPLKSSFELMFLLPASALTRGGRLKWS